ncbi:MAG TPA: hypothetical protein VIL94_06885 [Acidothermaceae bacterium]|jgi:hypothetical protein
MSSTSNDEHGSPIESYLDELVTRMPAEQPRALRQLLAETEAHLRDDAARAVAEGASPHDAEADAVRRFGPVPEMVGAEQRRFATPLSTVLRQIASTTLLLGSIGAITVGLSGVLAAVFQQTAGSRALVDVRPGQVLSGSDCARWLATDPTAHDCRAAAIYDWVGEVITYRISLGLLGVAALAVFFLLRRRWTRLRRWSMLPPLVSDTIATTAFATAGIWTLGTGIDTLAVGPGTGYGQWFSAAPVALAAAMFFGIRLVRDLRHQAA